MVFVDGLFQVRTADPPPPRSRWTFPPPFGRQEVIGEFPTADVVTIARHLPTGTITS
ncbi:hypothetical protein [Cryptosporangium phraense]|uniref:hypothetical protein n=1 Tax=Cryptosporangium phraense TaxID=2593070 RepID=UPI001F0DF5BD|nr:hypothetical protein [Cryptosporangium phraense]